MRNNSVLKLISSILLVALVIVLFILYQKDIINFASSFAYISTHHYLSWLLFILLYIPVTIAILPTVVLNIGAGLIFGPWMGFIISIAGATTGAMLSFFISRYLFHDFFHQRFSRTRFLQWSQLEDQNKLTGLGWVLRLVPIFPFGLLNYGMALTKINIRNYFVTTFFGIMPGTFAFVFLGDSLNNIFSVKFITVALALLILTFVTYRFRHRIIFREAGEIDINLRGTKITVNPSSHKKH